MKPKIKFGAQLSFQIVSQGFVPSELNKSMEGRGMSELYLDKLWVLISP